LYIALSEISSDKSKKKEIVRVKEPNIADSEELKDRIAIVSGAGSGLGKSIAIGVARAGANVAVLDLNEEEANKTCEMIWNEIPGNKSTSLLCDVTSEKEVIKALKSVKDKFGWLDILVNAAGIAPAGSLVDLSVDKWRLTLEVNLTGYFLMAKHAARMLIEQKTGGSIINLSSKSGLDASVENTPYNATKAGELHMTRGWAKELGQYNIRVNSVCPGNVFEGSKIWNKEYIEVCAQKYGIKPEEVIPYYISKTILNKEIKGQDVADAVVFLASNKSRMITGQMLVVDAGQVMVR
jgi:NAD(P)-dependent dehydrogenase (short-subunit alcohol dehydrogenase family)